MTDQELLQSALSEARAGNQGEASRLFAQVVREDPNSEQGWMGLGLCVSEAERKRYCFKRVIAINPDNQQARQALLVLDSSSPEPSAPNDIPVTTTPPNTPIEPPSTPAISPFLAEDTPSVEKIPDEIPPGEAEPVASETLVSQAVPSPTLEATAEPQPSSQPIEENGKTRRIRPLAIAAWIVAGFILIGLASVGLLFTRGGFDPLSLIRISPTLTEVPLPTPTIVPTQTTTPTSTITSSPTASHTPVPPTAIPSLRPTTAYSPSFSQNACVFGSIPNATVTCGFLTVPEDRTDPKSSLIHLAVAVFHTTSTSPASDPIIFLQGGPGGQAVMLSAENFPAFVEPFLADRDFITFDQRGTGLSTPALGCPDLETVYKQDIGGQIPSSSRNLVYTNAFRSCQGALTISGVDLGDYTTQASADDLNDVVKMLGYKQVDLYAVSYGTRLALVTMRDHPEIVHSAVLDSVVPVDARLFDTDPIRYETALQTLFDTCASDKACNTAYPDLKKVFWNTVSQLNAKPVPVTAPLPIGDVTENVDGSELTGITLSLLKSSALIPFVPETIYAVHGGDYSAFVKMQAALPYSFEGIDLGLYISLMCHEQILSSTVQDLQAALDTQPDVGRYFRLPFFGDAKTMFSTCKSWGALPPIEEENATVKSDIPALIIEGKFDPVTPPSFGKQVAANLSHAFYMEFPNLGHTPSVADQSGCAVKSMIAFFQNPTQEPDMSCLADIKPIEFAVP